MANMWLPIASVFTLKKVEDARFSNGSRLPFAIGQHVARDVFDMGWVVNFTHFSMKEHVGLG